MRKLLVASQKGGVGKTTSSINLAAAAAVAGARVLLFEADPLSSISASLQLAEHPQRQTLRQLGIDLPGVFVSNVIPGLDVLSPYEDGGCSDDELDNLLALTNARAFAECYGCVVLDSPPFLGANPGQLLSACNEFVLVMRAEAMAARTLPAFLELVQRSRKSEWGMGPGAPAAASKAEAIQMRGIVLTLPEGEQVGGRWERELRGRFGTRILPNVVPYDDSVGQALLANQIVSHAMPDSTVGQTYRGIVEHLKLAADGRDTVERTSPASALLSAAAWLKENAVVRKPKTKPVAAKVKSRVQVPVAVAPPPPVTPKELPPVIDTSDWDSSEDVLAVGRREYEGLPEPIKNRLTPAAPIPAVRVPQPAAAPVAPSPKPAAKPKPAPAAEPGFPVGQGVVWFTLAIAIGVGLRFLKLPDWSVPLVVGLAVAAVVALVARQFLLVNEEPPAKAPPSTNGKPPTTGRKSEARRRPQVRSGR